MNAETTTTTNIEAALQYAKQGYKIFPVIPSDKRPMTPNGFYAATTDAEQITRWWSVTPNANIGLPAEPNGLLIVDVDPKNGGSLEALNLSDAEMATPMQRTPSGGWHLVYRHPNFGEFKNNSNKVAQGVDIRTKGYIVVAPSVVNGNSYEWVNQLGHIDNILDVPAKLVFLLMQSQDRTLELAPRTQRVSSKPATVVPENARRQAALIVEENAPSATGYCKGALVSEVAKWLSTSDGEGRHQRLVDGSFSIGGLVGGENGLVEEEAINTLLEAGMYMKPDAPAEVERTVRSGILKGAEMPREIPEPPQSKKRGFYRMTDVGNGQRIVDTFDGRLLYAGDATQWYRYDGTRWVPATDAEMMAASTKALNGVWDELSDAAGSISSGSDEDDRRAASDRVKQLTAWAMQCESVKVRKAAIESASAEPEVLTQMNAFDSDPWILNVANGTLNLRTGTLAPHSSADKLTKLAPVSFDPTATAPMWVKFIEKFTQNDVELAKSLQMSLGYALTGITKEQSFWFLYGGGANGKSTLFETIFSLMGDYATKVNSDFLMLNRSGNNDRKQQEIARLAGVRLVVGSELPANKELDEALLKDLSGDETVTARALYRSSFTFKPTAKIWMVGNHQPTVGQSEGLWRRLWLVPALHNFSHDPERVNGASELLRGELSGILNWLLEGIRMWQEAGKIARPKAVQSATDEYRKEQDSVQEFIDERCKTGKGHSIEGGALYAQYVDWAEKMRIRPVSQNEFGKSLTSKGFNMERRTGGKRFRIGIAMEKEALISRPF